MSALLEERIYTIEDIEALPEGERAELIDGKIYMMAAPESLHEDICVELTTELNLHIREKKLPCKVLSSNTAVYLFDDTDYLLPDLKVICDTSKQDRKGYHGAPDFVVEVLSKSTEAYDKVTKLNLYMNAGVREYWIIDPAKRLVHKYVFIPEFENVTLPFDADVPVSICEDYSINLSSLGF